MKAPTNLIKSSLIQLLLLTQITLGVNPKPCSVELTVPDFIELNDDDDDENQVEDRGQQPMGGTEDDLRACSISISADSSSSGTVKVTFEAGGEKVGSTAWEDATKTKVHNLVWTVTDGELENEPPATFYLEGVERSDGVNDLELKATLEVSAEGERCNAVDPKMTTVYQLLIKDIPEARAVNPPVGAEILVTTKHPAIVGVKDSYISEILPDPGVPKTYKWKVNGAAPPLNTTSIKSYEHDVQNEAAHMLIDLAEVDMEKMSLAHFWRLEDSDGKIELKVTAGNIEIDKVITTEVKISPDPNREIYAPVIGEPQENMFRNPNGLNGQYFMNKVHSDWHRGPTKDDAIFRNPKRYDGAGFLNFHKAIIDSNKKWRATFAVPPVPAGAPAATSPKPSYLKIAGGNVADNFYGYVRLGEAAGIEEVGLMTVFPWHNRGHGAIGGEMESITTAVRSAGDVFWRWHTEIDTVRDAYSPDEATPVTLSPSGINVTPAASKIIEIEFDKPVSEVGVYGPLPLMRLPNTAGISPGLFKVDGAAAGGVLTPVGTDGRKYKLTLPNELAVGLHTIEFSGTRAIKPTTQTFEVK